MRHDDHERKSYFRSPDRVFKINGAWYFATREGDQGPFTSEAQVHMEIKRFITEQTELAEFQKSRDVVRKRALALADDDDYGPSIEVLPSRDRPRMRPAQRRLAKHKVYI